MNSENKKSTRKGKGALIALCVVLSIILVVLVAATVYVEVTLGRIRRSDQQSTLSSSEMDDLINETDPHDPDFTGPIYDKDDVTLPSDTAPEIINGEHVLNILLVGTDNDGSYRSRSDSMILCTIDTEKKTLTMTSFLRDMYLNIPGYGKQRINVAYMVGGFPMLYDTLRENFGVVVDYGVEVNFNSFTEVIDRVGGVFLYRGYRPGRGRGHYPDCSGSGAYAGDGLRCAGRSESHGRRDGFGPCQKPDHRL